MARKSADKPSLEQRWKDTDAMNLRWARYYLARKDQYGEDSLMIVWANKVIERLEKPDDSRAREL